MRGTALGRLRSHTACIELVPAHMSGKEQTLPLTGQAPLAGSEYSSALTMVTVLSLKFVTCQDQQATPLTPGVTALRQGP